MTTSTLSLTISSWRLNLLELLKQNASLCHNFKDFHFTTGSNWKCTWESMFSLSLPVLELTETFRLGFRCTRIFGALRVRVYSSQVPTLASTISRTWTSSSTSTISRCTTTPLCHPTTSSRTSPMSLGRKVVNWPHCNFATPLLGRLELYPEHRLH